MKSLIEVVNTKISEIKINILIHILSLKLHVRIDFSLRVINFKRYIYILIYKLNYKRI